MAGIGAIRVPKTCRFKPFTGGKVGSGRAVGWGRGCRKGSRVGGLFPHPPAKNFREGADPLLS
jgi:hypothetical protein